MGVIFFVASFFLATKRVVINPAVLIQSSSQEEKDVPSKVLGIDNDDGNSEITLFLVGDIMLNRGVEYYVKKEGKGDWRFPFLKIAKDFQRADIAFGNLEGPISDKGQRVGSRYSFRASPKVVEGLKYAGFDILSLANNHAFDYGRKALEQTMEILEENNIDYVGAGFNFQEAFWPKILEVKGTKIAFLAFTNLGSPNWTATDAKPGIAWIGNVEEAEESVKEAKTKADIVIVSLHSGEEYSKNPTPFQKDFAKIAIDTGADLIVGHHSHVVQPIEKYKGSWIAYSLGNFIFDQSFSQETMKGLILKVIIANKKIKEILPIEIKINRFFQPEIYK